MNSLMKPMILAALCCAACTSSTPRPGVTLADGGTAGTEGDGGMIATGSSSGVVTGSSTAATSSGTVASSGPQGSSGINPASSGTVTTSSSAPIISCQSSRDCRPAEICVEGGCVAGCESDNDCPMNRRICDLTVMPHGACVQCASPGDCQFMPNAMCDDGFCRVPCSGSGQCFPPFTCRASDNVCVRCTEDAQCGQGRICDTANNCVDGCRSDMGCSPGEICEGSQCTDGCRVSPNSCPVGSICRADPNGATSCQTGCNTPSDCGDATNYDCTNNQCVRHCGTDNDCPNGSICSGTTCQAGCRLPMRDCDRGEYCNAPMGPGQCVPGCNDDNDCPNFVENRCEVMTHTCVECLDGNDCQVPGFDQGMCTGNVCSFACNPMSGFDRCRGLGLECDAMTMTCVECRTADDCDPGELCTNNRCALPATGRGLCAKCESDAQCGGEADLCVTRTVGNETEVVCGVACTSSDECPSGTTCQEARGAGGTTAHQCLPSNSVHQATCAARADLMAEADCQDSRQCGILGQANAQAMGDAICSGAGASEGLCSVRCSLGGRDCPEGFFCEDPPDTMDRMFLPRCAPNP